MKWNKDSQTVSDEMGLVPVSVSAIKSGYPSYFWNFTGKWVFFQAFHVSLRTCETKESGILLKNSQDFT